MEAHSVKVLTQKCWHELNAVAQWYRTRAEPTAEDSCALDLAGWAADQQMRLNLFSEVLGVGCEGRSSVEYRLRTNAAIKNAIIQLLEAVSHNTQCIRGEPPSRHNAMSLKHKGPQHDVDQSKDMSRPREEKLFDSAVERVGRDIASLVNFAVAIRSRSMQQYYHRSKDFEPKDDSGTSLLPYFEKVVEGVLDASLENLRAEDHDSKRQRIKDTIIRRWRRICYCKYRSKQLQSAGVEDRSSFDGHEEPEQSVRALPVAPQDRQLEPRESRMPLVASQKATTLAGSIAAHNVGDRAPSVISSVAFTATDAVVARIPKLRKSATRNRGATIEFDCPLCKMPQEIKASQDPAQQHRAWEKHAYHDLEPYICLVEDCDIPEATYQSMQAWSAHNVARHAQTTWACEVCPEFLDSQSQFEVHMRGTHQASLSKDEMEFVAKACARPRHPFSACQFCNAYAAPAATEAESRTAMAHREAQMLRCMANHMKLLALTSLPDDLSVCSGSGGSNSLLSAASGISRDSLPNIAPFSTDGHSTEQVKQILVKLQTQFTKDRAIAATADWVSDCELTHSQGIPDDHTTLLQTPIPGHEHDFMLAASMSGEDFIGTGPPLYDGKPLTLTDPYRLKSQVESRPLSPSYPLLDRRVAGHVQGGAMPRGSHASSQPDDENPLYDLQRWIKEHMVDSFDVKTGDKLAHGFMPSGQVENYLQEGNFKRTRKVLTAAFRDRQPTAEARDVAKFCPRIFCILVLIGKAKYVGPFAQYNDLGDHRLPFATEPPGFPASSNDPDFFQAFYEKQWSFCAPELTPRATPQRWQDQYILPFTQLTRVGDGGSAIVWKAVLRVEHDKLSDKPQPGGCYAIKTFRIRSIAHVECLREVLPFRHITKRIPNTTHGIIKFFGSFEYSKTFNIILEFADGGTLEQYFANQTRPSSGRDILSFWQNMLETINALHMIHENYLHPHSSKEGTLMQGWHQDLRPENILVFKNGSDNPYNWSFKVSDLGLSHFKTITIEDKEAADLDTFGTKTYGAPECYALTDFTVKSKNFLKQSADIWSLGAILSEAAVWVVKGGDAVQEYRNQRKAENDRQPDFRDGNCFHNGRTRLRAVDQWHADLRAEIHLEDFITHRVIQYMIDDMLEPNEAARPGTQQLDSKKLRIIAAAKKDLDDSTVGLHITSAQRQLQNTPAMSLPARIRTSDGVVPSSSRPIYGPQSNYYASPTHTTDQAQHRQPSEWEEAAPDAIYGSTLQQEPEDMYSLQNNPGAVAGLPGPEYDRRSLDRNPEQPYCSVGEAWEWWKKMKYGEKTAKLPHHDDLMYYLKGRNHVFIIDDSRSMKQYWLEVERLLNLLAYITKTQDPDGVELYFLSSERKHSSAKASELAAIVNRWTPNKRTNLSTRLNAVFRDYCNKIDRNKTPRRVSNLLRSSTALRKLSIYVLTDGVWEMGDEKQDCLCIKMMTDKLEEEKFLRDQIGIQFISFGGTQEGLSTLGRLNSLNQDRGLARDIIDTEPSNGNIWKMLLGAINSKFENDQPRLQTMPLPSSPPYGPVHPFDRKVP